MDSIRLAFISRAIGGPSTVWMHRQLAGLLPVLALAVTWDQQSPKRFPIPDDKLTLVPDRFQQTIHGWRRRIDSMVWRRYGGPRYGLAFDRWLTRNLRAAHVNAALAQFGPCAMAVERACRSTRIPVFAHFHGYDITAALRNNRYRAAMVQRWHPFAGMIVVAEYQRAWLLNQGYSDSEIAVIPCGAPVPRRSSHQRAGRANTGGSPEACRFLFVGRFVDKKDPLAVLRAFERCWNVAANARLTMAGFGELEADCRRWVAARSAGLQRAISFPGPLTPEQVAREMQLSDAYVQHSRTAPNGDKEGWPVTIGEAMAAGLPILATRHGGIVDQVTDGVTGHLCDEGDWEAMAQRMIALVRDPSLRKRLGENARHSAAQFEQSRQVGKLLGFIESRVRATKRQSA